MNVLVYLSISIVAFLIAGRFYSKYIAGKMGEDTGKETPACCINDGRDFVPTKTYILFAFVFNAYQYSGIPIIYKLIEIVTLTNRSR